MTDRSQPEQTVPVLPPDQALTLPPFLLGEDAAIDIAFEREEAQLAVVAAVDERAVAHELALREGRAVGDHDLLTDDLSG